MLEQLDQAERRRVMLLAHLGGGLLPHLLRQHPADGLLQHQLLPPRRAFRYALLQHRLPRGPAKIVVGRDELIDETDGLGGRGAQHAAGQHGGHGVRGASELDRAHRAVQSREDAELDLGEAEPRPLLAIGDAPVAGESKLEPAAEAIAVDGGDDGDGEPIDAVEQLERLPHHVLDLLLGVEALELADVGAGDEAPVLGAHDDEALDLAARGSCLDRLDDLAELLGRASAERVHALALAVHHRPGDALEVDREAPVLQIGECRRHAHSTRRQYARAARAAPLRAARLAGA